MTRPPSPNERSVRISRTTLYRSVAGTTPDLEFAEEVLTQPVQTRQTEMDPEIAVRVTPPESVKPPLLHKRAETSQNPAMVPIKHPGRLCALEVLPQPRR